MSISADRARLLALTLEDAFEAPHFDRTASRTPRRIFATLSSDGVDMSFMFDPPFQEFYCEHAPTAFAPVSGAWGRKGATRWRLRDVDARTFRSALAAAHARANAPRDKPARKRR